MKTTRKELEEVAREYTESLSKEFPGIEVAEIVPGGFGADLWIAVKTRDGSTSDVLRAAAELNAQWFDKRGLNILVTVRGGSRPIPV
ncbi:MAG: hypothetical protein HYY02_03385 [Chloroflexi bacterium]|nr:hypothetical protein [Chloroflexota bacterium]